MDTKEVLTFLMLSQTLSYQRAADKLQYARSTLFSHIQSLERVPRNTRKSTCA